MQPADFLIEGADLIATCAGPAPRVGSAQQDISLRPDAAIASYEGRIVYVGPQESLTEHVAPVPGAIRIDARGAAIVPGFVDPHTHAVYAGDRHDELRRRLAGASYADIAAGGGGIARTVALTRAAAEDELVASARRRLDEMAACGTTTCEVKSGYGLDLESELKQLRAISRLNALHAVDVVPTFLGAHDIPAEYRQSPDEYVKLVIEEMIPAVAKDGLAEW